MTGQTESGFTLPSFRDPPVVEVAMCVGFEPLPGLQFAALADLRARWRSEYPRTEEYPFLESSPDPAEIRIEFGPPPRRLWLISEHGDRVIQIQRDRLIANWRAIPGSGLPYPRYDLLRAEFERRLIDFQSFLADSGIAPQLKPGYVEVTYVNVVEGEQGGLPLQISDVMNVEPETAEWRQKGVRSSAVTRAWELADFDTTLSTAANIDVSAANCPVVLQIVAKTRISEKRNAMQALDLSREFVVGTFGVITTEKMQQKWGRE